jgi:hypothetical protein
MNGYLIEVGTLNDTQQDANNKIKDGYLISCKSYEVNGHRMYRFMSLLLRTCPCFLLCL